MLYQLSRVEDTETIPEGRYLVDAGPDLPRVTIEVEADTPRGEFLRSVGTQLGVSEERVEEMIPADSVAGGGVLSAAQQAPGG